MSQSASVLRLKKLSPSASWATAARRGSAIRSTLVVVAEAEAGVDSGGAIAERKHEDVRKVILVRW